MSLISEIKKVVTPVDFSDNAKIIAESAAYFAGRFNGSMHLVFACIQIMGICMKKNCSCSFQRTFFSNKCHMNAYQISYLPPIISKSPVFSCRTRLVTCVTSMLTCTILAVLHISRFYPHPVQHKHRNYPHFLHFSAVSIMAAEFMEPTFA